MEYYGDIEIYRKVGGPEEGADGKDCGYEALCNTEPCVAERIFSSAGAIFNGVIVGEKNDGAKQVAESSEEVCNCQKDQYGSGDSTHIFP